ncbi:hypothetical protein IscW_ISCW022962 [Ixodes scapularis]|uniref:Uncharacterized protein n=1 Tax=Ixodes scapularis TaxID=6945 RepID=B7QHH1_IXOSC|nr:hypothetical protein IscW_ISCW022962 [Ixodes scapularis]|eukprot:XP_002414628.1 hypothetical protein IscW_ISCW022962 [Ixodes scapularis]
MGIVGLGAHFYAFGFHYDWSLLATVVVLPVVVYVIVPTLYQLKVTSVFEVRILLIIVGWYGTL